MEKGFTLIELVSVMIIAAILAAVAVPRLTRSTQLSGRAAADALLAAFQYAQLSAQRQDTATSVRLSANGFDVEQSGTPVTTAEGPYTFSFGNNVRLTQGAGSLVTYGADGAIGAPSASVFTLTDGDDSWQVLVEPGGYAHE